MDKYLIRLKMPQGQPSERPKHKKVLKQAKIENLRGVVNIKEIEKCAKILSSSKDTKQILESLEMLSKKTPSIDIMKETGIGKIVRKLSKSTDLEIASKAEDVYDQWKEHVEKISSRKPLEVSSDEQTRERRGKARELISKHLESDLSERIEGEIYKQCGQLLNKKYRKTVRSLVLALQHREGFRDNLIKEKIKFREYVKQFL